MTNTELKEIEDRCNSAQQGPWMVGITEHKQFLIKSHVEPAVRISHLLLPEEVRQRLAEWDVQDAYKYVTVCPEAEIDRETEKTLIFVAHSREDVPKLIAEIRRLRAENAKLKGEPQK